MLSYEIMNSLKNKLGVTLVEILMTTAISGVVALIGIQVFNAIQRQRLHEENLQKAAAAYKEISLYLKPRIGGPKSFQGVDFRIPNNTPCPPINVGNFANQKQSRGAGIYVDSGQSFQGTNLAATDLLYYVVKLDEFGDFVFDTNFQVTAQKINTTLPAFFTVGEYNALSNVKNADLFTIAMTTFTLGTLTLTLPLPDPKGCASPGYLYAPNQGAIDPPNSNKYVLGDLLYKAEIEMLGFQSVNKQLIVRKLSKNTNRVLAENVSAFTVQNIFTPVTGCTTTASPTYVRSNWTGTNSINSNPNCYKGIDSIRLSITIDPAPPFTTDFRLN